MSNPVLSAATGLWTQAVAFWQKAFEGKTGLEWTIAKYASPVVALLVLWFVLWLLVKLSVLIVVGVVVAGGAWLIFREVTKKPAG